MYTHKRSISIACALGMMVSSGAYAQTVSTTSAPQNKPAVCIVVGEHGSGEKNADVSAIQRFLASRGYTLAQSGEFDAATVATLKQFQTLYKTDIIDMQGLTSAPGIWDIYTAMKARELVCGATVAPVPVVSTPSVVPSGQTTTTSLAPVSATQESLQPSGNVIPERSAFTPGVSTPANVQQTNTSTPTVATSNTPVVGISTTEPLVCLALELEPGMKHNDDVRTMQKWLMSQGYNKVEATGNYGTYTKRAVTHFQNEYAADILTPAGLTRATGVWGPRTAAKASEMGLCAYDDEVDAGAEESVSSSASSGVIPERSAYSTSTTQTTPATTTRAQTAPQSATSDTTTSLPATATTASLEEIYPGVCLPKTIGPIGTEDARGNVLSEVKMLQRFLIARGYTKVEATGYYGPTTQRAIAHFQEENKRDILEPAGLIQPTGVWGVRTAIKASELGLCENK